MSIGPVAEGGTFPLYHRGFSILTERAGDGTWGGHAKCEGSWGIVSWAGAASQEAAEQDEIGRAS
jgi:hypothetical protein